MINQVEAAVATLKNSVIGSQRQKDNIVEHGVIARLIHLLVDPEMNSKIKIWIFNRSLRPLKAKCFAVNVLQVDVDYHNSRLSFTHQHA